MKDLLMLAIRVSIFGTVFGFGLQASGGDLLYVVRRPGLLVRSLIAVFVAMPVLAVLLVRYIQFEPTAEIVLVALAISPVPPLLPGKEVKAGGHLSYALGLMVVLGLVCIVAIPGMLVVINAIFGGRTAMSPSAVARLVLMSTLLPLLAGVALRAWLPTIATRIARPIALASRLLLLLGVLALFAGTFRGLWSLIGSGAGVAMVIFTVAGLAIGHLLGGPDPDDASVLALSTACRHPAIAFSLAAANFPDQRFGATIVLYLLVSAIAGMPYLAWRKRVRSAQA